MEPSDLNIFEDQSTYTAEECSDLLKRIHQGNRSMGGLKLIAIGYGIVGELFMTMPYEVSLLLTIYGSFFYDINSFFLSLSHVFVNLGFIQFLEPYYMLIITERKKIGTMLGAKVYGVSKSMMVIIPNPIVRSKKAYCNTEKRFAFVFFSKLCFDLRLVGG